MLHVSDRVGNLAQIGTDSESLKEHTNLHPISPKRELDRITFSRSREVKIDWDSVVGNTDGDGKPYTKGWGTEYLKKELEARWGVGNGPSTDADVKRIANFYVNTDWPLIIFKDREVERYFYVVLDDTYYRPDSPIFETITEYNQFWAAVKTISSALNLTTELFVVDLAPAIIYRQYRELKALESLGSALAANADELAKKQFSEFPSPAELEAVIDGYTRMQSVKTDLRIKLERLRDRAKDLGYYLALEDETIKFPDGTSDKVEAGQLYQPYLSEIQWRTLHQRRYLVRSDYLFFSTSWVIEVPYYTEHAARVTKYKKTIPDFDPWIEVEHELIGQGFTVFRFERIGSRYITVQGETIENIAERCEVDDNFSRQCAILIPVYDQSLVSGEILSKYIVIKRPKKGIQPLHLPMIYIEEDLLFSTHFHRVEVGELVETINLAPGEEREILIEKSTLEEREERRTATSISDLTESDKVDLSTEMEKEFSNSNEKTSTSSLSAKAGGSYGPFSGSVSGSTSSTQTTRQFARDLQKVANKASRSVTRQTRQEVKTDASVKTNVSTKQSTKIQIKNINDGRSLNLLLYQLYNIYNVSLSLERLTFTFLSGREVIAGSGIVIPEVYSLAELPVLLGRLTLDSFPLQPNSGLHDPKTDSREEFLKIIVDAIKATLNEYKEGVDESSDTIRIGDWEVPHSDPAEKHIRVLVEVLNKLQYIGGGIVPPGADANADSTLVVGSPGLFLDTFVGVRPGTEPYSESMRSIELERRLAEVWEVVTRSNYQEALARRLIWPDPGNVVVGKALDLQNLELNFVKAPLVGDWSLFVFEAFVQDFAISAPSLQQHVRFPKDQAWLDHTTSEVVRIVHKATKLEMVFLV